MRNGLSASEAGKLGGLAAIKTKAVQRQIRIDYWNSNPKLCKFCESPIAYEKRRNDFCSQSCGAAFNNKGVRRHGEAPPLCLVCQTPCAEQRYKFCSVKCNKSYAFELTKDSLLVGENKNVSVKRLKNFLLKTRGHCCEMIECGITEWRGKPVPLVMDHIDGNPYDNRMSNLRLLCHNCNAQTPTFAGRNKGKGRFERAKRYQLEKEILKDKPI